MTFVPDRKSTLLCAIVSASTSYKIRARPYKSSDVISLKYTRSILIVSWVIFRFDSRFQSAEWISRFLDFRLDFWISIGFLDFRLDFCRQCTRFLSWRTPRINSLPWKFLTGLLQGSVIIFAQCSSCSACIFNHGHAPPVMNLAETRLDHKVAMNARAKNSCS